MYNIYKTDAFIFSGGNFGEANRYLYFFTKDLGLIRASAQGVRRLHSKLRFSLQPFCYSEVSFVRGKEIWRVTGAKKSNKFTKIFSEPQKLYLIARIFSLLKRLINGESKDELLFDELNKAFSFLEQSELSFTERKNFEIVLVIKIFKHLGYWDQELPHLFNLSTWEPNKLGLTETEKKESIALINKRLSYSQL